MSGFELASLVITSIGTACWGVCFWWMRRISQRQDAMLKEQQQVMQRIEQLSEKEHELIREVHPNVEELKESVKDVADKVSSDGASAQTPRRASSPHTHA